MKKIFKIYLTTLPLFLVSCYRDIDLDKYKEDAGKDILTVNSIITPDSTIAVAATKTFFFSDIHHESIIAEGLDISLSINGTYKGCLEFDSKKKLYVSDLKPKPNDVVDITTEYKGNKVYATEVVPEEVNIESVTVKMRGPFKEEFNGEYYMFTYNIVFKDNADRDDFYFLRFREAPRDPLNPGKSTGLGQIDYSHNIVFQKLKDYMGDMAPSSLMSNPSGLPFTDEGINGMEHTLTVEEKVLESMISKEMKRSIKLFAINKAYYEYIVGNLIYFESMDETLSGMIDIGLADPMRTISNINNGIGIFGCYTLSEKMIDVLPLVFHED